MLVLSELPWVLPEHVPGREDEPEAAKWELS